MQILAYIGYIILALLVLLLMITIHELGHYIAGKIFKFKINEFSIGFGPKLFSKKKKNGEIFSIRAIPLGGYCAFAGEDDISENPSNVDKDSVFKDGENDVSSNNRLDVNSQNDGKSGNAKNVEKSGVIKFAGAITGTAKATKPIEGGGLKNFNDQSPPKRIAVLAAGGVFNILSAVLFCFLFIAIVGLPQPQISKLSTDEVGNAYVTQLEVGDVITHINGKQTSLNYLFNGRFDNSGITDEYIGTELKLTVKKADGKVETIVLTKQKMLKWNPVLDLDKPLLNKRGKPIKDEEGNILYQQKRDDNGELMYEIALDKDGEYIYEVKYGIYNESHLDKGFVSALKNSVPLTGKMSWFVLKTLGQLLTGKLSCTNVSGPVGTVTGIASNTMDYGYSSLLLMLPLIAANLGVFNLLPVPALDGSKIIFAIVEWIRKKPLNRKVEGMIHAVGLLVIFGLVIILDVSGMFLRCI